MNENIPSRQLKKDRAKQQRHVPPLRTLCECMPGQINLLFISLHSERQSSNTGLSPSEPLDRQKLCL